MEVAAASLSTSIDSISFGLMAASGLPDATFTSLSLEIWTPSTTYSGELPAEIDPEPRTCT